MTFYAKYKCSRDVYFDSAEQWRREVADGLATGDVDVHYDVSDNYCSAVNCQNRRKNCVCKSFLVCVSNVNNCKPARRPLGGYRTRDREVRTIQEITRERTSRDIYTVFYVSL